MTETIAGLPFWEVRFDEQGDGDPANATAVSEIAAAGITDLFVFSHGWNNNRAVARSLYDGWFGQLAPQLAQATRPVTAGLVGVYWPSQRWSDEPIPDFATGGAAATGGGSAAATSTATYEISPTLSDDELAVLHQAFPGAATEIDRMAALLAGPPDPAAVEEFATLLRKLAAGGSAGPGDGAAAPGSADGEPVPPMLADDPGALFTRFTVALRDSGARTAPQAEGGAAGIGDVLSNVWNGAKEALRQTTYWQMKNRAGVVGQHGVAPFALAVHTAAPQLRVHLIGHSFGARVVSFALAGLPDDPRPVKSLTLLQGAFSHFAFADPLPFDANRRGALAGTLPRIDGPLTVMFSSHDSAVGRFYPLASLTAHQDSAAADDLLYRWGGMGADGAQGVGALLDSLQPATASAAYRFRDGQALNVDASDIVCHGDSQSGAHSDIIHPEVTWLVLRAAGVA